MKKKNLAVILPAGIVVAFLIVMALWNIRLPWRALKTTLAGDDRSLSGFVEQLDTRLNDSFSPKLDFVNLNGWLTLRLGQSRCNDVFKLNNGMLTSASLTENTLSYSRDVIEFRDFLADQGIEFLFLGAPYKIDLEGQLLPEGYDDFANEYTDAFLSALADGGVDILDLRATMSATPEQATENFLATDHHWNFTGAFRAFQQLTAYLQERFPNRGIDLSRTDLSQWETHEFPNASVGSYGRRVGIYFGGSDDDVIYYTPRGFEDTRMSCGIPGTAQLFKGSFADAYIREQALEPVDGTWSDAYSLYIGGNYSLLRSRNPDAPSDLRVLLIRDSFFRPLQSFLATEFQEIDSIDPREFETGSIAEYVQYFQPDIVIEVLFPISTTTVPANFIYGTAGAGDFSQRRTVLERQDAEISAGGGYAAIPVTLERGRSCLLRFDDIEFTAGASEGVSACLFDADAGKVLDIGVFDVEYCRARDDFTWFFTVPDGAGANLELRLSAGISGDAADCAAVYRGVRLEAIG